MEQRLLYVVDDEKQIRELLKTYLEKEGYKVELFEDGQEVLDRFSEQTCDMLIIDIMMPNVDGYTLCREIRKTSEVPIIIVSAKDEEIDRILGLELGSDDYISKPFSPRELIVRVKNIFRRINRSQQATPKEVDVDQIHCKDLIISKENRTVLIDHKEIKVTSKEFDLLFLLIKNKNMAFSRDTIIERIWGYDYFGETRQVDHLIKRLRKKMLEANAQCQIETVWGYGYKISG
ncbi:response regulator transcription factor [Vallitalea okinawensis]|uniref:response regulator transcription factor n=1 Tax=Vallitalea okinawensis TaxID=2078660 RepID=UPI000CFC92D8|nr:response regulator transcription factor [Vallitalea okinawensis]